MKQGLAQTGRQHKQLESVNVPLGTLCTDKSFKNLNLVFNPKSSLGHYKCSLI